MPREVAAGVGDRDVGGQYDRVRGDHAAVSRHPPLVDGQSACVIEHQSAAGHSRAGEAEAVVAWVELSLVVEAHRRLDFIWQVDFGGEDCSQSRLACRIRLALDIHHALGRLGVGVGRRVPKAAVDVVGGHELADIGDCRFVGRRVYGGPFDSPCVDEPAVDRRVQRRHLGGGVARRARTQVARLDDDNGHAGSGEQPCRCQSGDPGAHDDDIGPRISVESFMVGRRRRADPQRSVPFIGAAQRCSIRSSSIRRKGARA